MRASSRNRGTTLIETVVAIIVLGIAIPPLIAIYSSVAGQTVDRTFQGAAIAYADGLMEEIISKSFEDPDESAGSFGTEEGSRASFDDLDDYDGLSNSPPTRLDGTALDDYGGFTRSASVSNVTASDPDPVTAESDGSTDYKRIVVTVVWSGGSGGEFTLKTLRTNIAAGDDGTPGGGSGPLDEAASAASAERTEDKKLELELVSISASDLVIESFDLSSDPAENEARSLSLEEKKIWQEPTGLAIPTGEVDLNMGSTSWRTVEAGDSPSLEIKFEDKPAGSLDYTLILNFTDGSSSTIDFTVSW